MATANAFEKLKTSRMGAFQYFIILFCIVSNISDGFDSLAMAFVAPAISRDWNVDPKYMGVVFSAASFGLVGGSLLIAPMADRFGRRPVIVSASLLASVAMLGAAFTNNAAELAACRFFTGLAIGALIPSLNVMVIEYSNDRLGNLFLALLHVGFAIGAIICSATAIFILEDFGWRSIFLVAAAISAVLGVLALVALPESLAFLVSRRPKGAERKIARTLQRMNLSDEALSIDEPVAEEPKKKVHFGVLLTPMLLVPTLLLWLAASAHYFVSYFKTNWTPSILVEAGLGQSAAISSGIVMGVTAAAGNILMGLLAARFGVYRLTMFAFAAGTASLVFFGMAIANPILLLSAAGMISFFIQATFTGTLIGATRFYSPDIRSTGVGIVVGLGRIGGIAGPIIAGVLISLGWDRSAYYPVFAAFCALGALAMWGLHRRIARKGMAQAPTPTVPA